MLILAFPVCIRNWHLTSTIYIEHRPAKPQLIEPQWAFASAGPQSWLIQWDRPLGQLGQGHPLRPSGYGIQQGQDAIPR